MIKARRYIIFGFVLMFSISFNSCQKNTDEILSLLQEIKQQNSDLKSQVSLLQKTTDSLSAALKLTNQNISSMDKKIDSVRNQLSAMIIQINSLSTQLSQANVNIADIQKKIAELQVKCQELVDLIQKLSISMNISEGLIAFYPFNGNANDESGNGFNGFVSQARLSSDRKNIPDRSYDFNYLGARIQIPITAQINGLKEVSISHWVKIQPNGGGTSFGNWIYSSTGLGPVGIFLGISNDKIFCSLNDGQDIISNSINLDFQAWHHITLTFNGILPSKKVRLFLDGTELTIASITNNTPIPSNLGIKAIDTFIGGRQCIMMTGGDLCYNGLTPNFQGKIDDLRIYNRALTEQEIMYLATH